MNLDSIDTLTKADCKVVIERARDRLRQLQIEDPMVYGIQRIFHGNRRYYTAVPMMGGRQLLATDMGHSALWLTSSCDLATQNKERFEKNPLPGEVWKVFKLPKSEAIQLPCYHFNLKYGERKEMTG